MIVAIIIGAVVIVVGGVAGAILLLGSDDEASADSVEEVAQAFVDALSDEDCDALEGMVTDRMVEEVGGCDPEDFTDVPEFGDPEVIDESEDRATVEIEVTTAAGESGIMVLSMVNEDGWLVDSLGERSATPSLDPTAPTGDPTEPTESTGDPQATAATFVEAARTQDCATLDSVTTDRFRAAFDCPDDFAMPHGAAVEFEEPRIVSQTDTVAMAEVVLVLDGMEVTLSGQLVNDDGQWLVDSIDLSDFPTDFST